VAQTVTLADGRTKTYWKGALRHNGKRHWVSAATRVEAVGKLRKLQRELEDGAAPANGKLTLAAFLAEWLESSVRPTTRSRTYQAYAERMRLHVLPTLGSLKLTELTPQHVQKLYAGLLDGGLSSSTVGGVHAVLHRALDQAVRWDYIKRNPTDGVDVPQPKPEPARPFDAVELAAFMDGIRGDEHEWLWTLLLMSGLRFGEVAALRWRDVDFDLAVLHVRHTITRDGSKGYSFTEPKTPRSRRTVPLPPPGLVALHEQQQKADDLYQLSSVWEAPDLVFPSRRGTPLRESHIIVAFHRLLDRLGLERRRLHDLRYTYATRLFALDVHPRVTQELLGHASITTTMNRYTASVPSVVREAVARLG
jgi:integrase